MMQSRVIDRTCAVLAILTLATLLDARIAHAEEASSAAPAVTDAQSHLPVGKIQIAGHLGQRMGQCMENLITACDVDRLVRPFRDKSDSIPAGGFPDQWRCDYWGKWFSALALGYAHQPTDEHRQLMDRAVAELIATQDPDGYIGSFIGDNRLTGGYDVWGRQCVILGLTSHYDVTGNKTALDAACRELDCLIDELQKRNERVPDLGWPMFKGLAPSVIVESAARLFNRTGVVRYRDFARQIAAQWNEPSKFLPQGLRLVDDALAGKPAREIGFPKAYEQLYCFIGICELYRATGDRQYLDAAVALAKRVQEEELFITGTGSREELWFQGRTQQTSPVLRPAETCVTAHWMYFCWQLLCLTGDPAYADALETSLYNALLGALMPEGHWWGYYQGLSGERGPSPIAQADIGLSCCVVSGMRGLMLTPFWTVMQSADGPVVNSYFPGKFTAKTAAGNGVSLTMDTDYPREATVRLRVETDQPQSFAIALRIPSWSRQTRLTVNGEAQPAQPGTYAKIHRQWSKGDCIELNLDMRGQVLDAPDGNGQVALKRGPIVLALDQRLTSSEQGAQATIDRAAAAGELKLNPQAAQKAGVWMALDVPFLVNGQNRTLVMCDYASAGNQWSETDQYRTWLAQPLDLAAIYETGQTLQTLYWSDVNPRPTAPPVPEKRTGTPPGAAEK